MSAYTVYEVPMTSITTEVCKEAGVKPRDAERSKNFFALGLISWLYTRPTEATEEWIEKRFAGLPAADRGELFAEADRVVKATVQPERAERVVEMRSVAGEEDPAAPELARDALVDLVEPFVMD